MNPQRMLIQAGTIADGSGFCEVPGAIVVEGGRIIGAGSPQEVGSLGSCGDCQVIHRPDAVVIPALVNAHAHLDLSHVGCEGIEAPPQRHQGIETGDDGPGGGRASGGGGHVDFVTWIEQVRDWRAVSDSEIAASVSRGIDLARAGGTAILGDIAGARSLIPIHVQRQRGLAGVSFREVFGLGQRQSLAIDFLRQSVRDTPGCERGVVMGVQPHAPYSCGPEVYHAAVALGSPLSTHLAETLEELQFLAEADGPLADLIKRLGLWDSMIVPIGKHPIDYLLEIIKGFQPSAVCYQMDADSRQPIADSRSAVLAHLNYIEDRHIPMLASLPPQVTVAYCPRASAYFGHPHDGHAAHRYREMLAAGVNVALGTDSLICLDTPDRLSVLDEMRYLHRRDGFDPTTLLRMGTVNGAIGLGFDPALVTLAPCPTAGLLSLRFDPASSIDPLTQVMRSDVPPEWILGPLPGDNSWWAGQ